ncbi:MAG: peptide-methionine (S)-S-oxide reductase MsrA [Planctomycetaceae bacterium]|nr:peptide-methionine (S)-S-oxide reductase MsrA [Planctomycetaceae bacterium]
MTISDNATPEADGDAPEKSGKLAKATFAAGCFWCTEAVFLRLKGVVAVKSGYAGGSIPNPTYKQVCTGLTGHAECIQIDYDPTVITFEQMLDVFFHTHDPTTLNRQGGDVGTQYRSAVFYHDEKQKTITEKVIAELNKSDDFDAPIVTTLEELTKFYAAEDYHQDYFKLNPRQPYCQFVVGPKVEKFQKRYKELLKKD